MQVCGWNSAKKNWVSICNRSVWNIPFNLTRVTVWPCKQPSIASFAAFVFAASAESWLMNVSNGMDIAWPLIEKDVPVWMSEKTLYVWLVSRVSCVYSYVRRLAFATTRNASFTNTPGMLILMVPRVSNCLPTSGSVLGGCDAF